MLRALSKDANSLGLWKTMLPRVVFSYNSSNHSTTGRAPFYMAMLRIPRSFLTITLNKLDWDEARTRAFLDHSTQTTPTASFAQAPAAHATTTSTAALSRTLEKTVW